MRANTSVLTWVAVSLFSVHLAGCRGKSTSSGDSSASVQEGSNEQPAAEDGGNSDSASGDKATVVGVAEDDWALAQPATSVSGTNLTLTGGEEIKISRLDGNVWNEIQTDARSDVGRLIVHLEAGAYLIYWKLASGRIARGFALVSQEQAKAKSDVVVRLGVTSEFAAKILEQIPSVAGGVELIKGQGVSESLLVKIGGSAAFSGATFSVEDLKALASSFVQATQAVLKDGPKDLKSKLTTRPEADDLADTDLSSWQVHGANPVVQEVLKAVLEALAGTFPAIVQGGAAAEVVASLGNFSEQDLKKIREIAGAMTVTEALNVATAEAPIPQNVVKAILASEDSPDNLADQIVNASAASPSAPTASPAAGAFGANVSVTLTTTTSGAEIRYTLDNSSPTCVSGTKYVSPVALATTAKVRAVACKSGVASAIAEAQYVLGVFDPAYPTAYGSTSTGVETSWQLGVGTSKTLLAYRADGTIPGERCAAGNGVTIVDAGTSTTKNVTDLVPDREYAFRLCGVSTNGAYVLAGVVVKARTTVASHRIFLSSPVTVNSQLGVAGLHAQCQADASAASLPGVWRAIVASKRRAPIHMVRISGAIFNIKSSPEQVWSASEFWPGFNPTAPITLADKSDPGAVAVWTGIRVTATTEVASPADNCVDFTDDQGTGKAQVSTVSINSGSPDNCSVSKRVFCIDGQATLLPPARLMAQGQSDSTIAVTWLEGDPDASSYEIQRRTAGPSPFKTVGIVAGGSTTFLDNSVATGVSYIYRVRSVSATATSEYSYPTIGKARFSHRVFVTSGAYSSDLAASGGLASYDEVCQEHASDADLGGTWKAIMSTDSVNASDRVIIGGPIYNMNFAQTAEETLVANNATDLWDGTITSPIERDEHGRIGQAVAWTGSGADGLGQSGWTCDNFTSATNQGFIGSPTNIDSQWISGAVPQSCSNSFGIYCVDRQ